LGERVTPEVKVRDVMSSPVITIRENDTVSKAAKLMSKHEIGCVVVLGKEKEPIGLITERDIVRRVAAKNLNPTETKASKVMSRPLATIGPEVDVTEVARMMRQLKRRRLVVIDEGKVIGIVTSNDIAEITPSLISVIEEKSRIAPIPPRSEGPVLAGYCDQCSSWADHLKERDGRFLCPDCVADLEQE
jgi:CBS domain-containing protein